MTAHHGPLPVPARCAGRPQRAGLVLPYVTVQFADGSPDWSACVRSRVNQCMAERRCQVCAQRIEDRVVFFVGADQVPEAVSAASPIVTDVPPVHPVCGRYSQAACPMLAGRFDRYRGPNPARTERRATCDRPGCDCGGWIAVEDVSRAGLPVVPWLAVWTERYDLVRDGDELMAAVSHPLRIRAVPTTPMPEAM